MKIGELLAVASNDVNVLDTNSGFFLFKGDKNSVGYIRETFLTQEVVEVMVEAGSPYMTAWVDYHRKETDS